MKNTSSLFIALVVASSAFDVAAQVPVEWDVDGGKSVCAPLSGGEDSDYVTCQTLRVDGSRITVNLSPQLINSAAAYPVANVSGFNGASLSVSQGSLVWSSPMMVMNGMLGNIGGRPAYTELRQVQGAGSLYLSKSGDSVLAGGGQIDIRNLSVNFQEHSLYADIVRNDVTRVLIGRYSGLKRERWADEDGQPSLSFSPRGAVSADYELTGLVLSEQFSSDFAQSLALTEKGMAVLAGAPLFSQVGIHIILDTRTSRSVIPEPSSYALMSLGIVACVWARRRRSERSM